MAVCPDAALVRVKTAERGHSRWNTDGRGAVDIFKPSTAGCQAIQVWSLDNRISIAAGDVGVVLVGVDIEKIGTHGSF
jgi:hypothetical protein